MVEYARFVQRELDVVQRREMARVDDLALTLRARLTSIAEEIMVVHIHNAQSKAIQDLVAGVLVGVEFAEEVILTPQDGLVTRARPDLVFSLGEGRGVLAEVERGGTVNNNHDLKDIWKAHIALDAQHLFLIVPRQNTLADGRPREKPFPRVCNRIGAFFSDPRRYVDVVSAHVFGY